MIIKAPTFGEPLFNRTPRRERPARAQMNTKNTAEDTFEKQCPRKNCDRRNSQVSNKDTFEIFENKRHVKGNR